MTAPLITTITPNTGLASGRRRVTIRGMHFREPSSDSVETSVAVTFNGVAADAVVWMAPYRLEVVTPQYVGAPSSLPDAVDVVVTNLDDDGDAIAGEATTATDGFTYERPDLTVDSYLVTITREVLRVLRRNLIDNVAPSSDPDWSDSPASGLTAIGELPAIILDGPQILPSTLYNYAYPREIARTGADEVSVDAPPFTAVLQWDIVIIADRKIEALNLVNAAVRYFDRRPFLRIPEDTAASEYVEVDLHTEEWRPSDRTGDRLYVYESTIKIEPVYLRDDYGAADGAPVDGVVTEATLDSDSMLDLEVDSDV